ncbi:MAG TPA: AarF/UbiB family protein [Vicinamibacteria bacterium]|nr:AarF/UbiB family protein [Vicinamibacteria bacterium]
MQPTFILLALSLAGRTQYDLPTPLSHYQQGFDVEAEGRAILLELAASVPEPARSKLFMAPDLEEALALVDEVQWQRLRPRIASLLLHGSRVLEVIPEAASDWLPLVHDAFLVFLEGLEEKRFLDRVISQLRLPVDADRGQRVLNFIAETPSLQKLAQILARNPSLDPDFRNALQTIENGLETIGYEEVMEVIGREIDAATVKRYQIVFADHVLAEASVGAVVEARYVGESGEPLRAACKVLKPRAVSALEQDLTILDAVLRYLENHADFYEIGSMPLVDTFEEIREALSREVKVLDERENLKRAALYYRDNEAVVVPEVLPFSSASVTCMDFIEGVKVTDAFPGHPRERARLARRLSDALTFDVLFSDKDDSFFHGDPHAGNVFHVEDGGAPFRIALIDWGLAAEFDREEREKLTQLMVGLYLGNTKRLANNVDVLVEWEPEGPEDRARMRALLEKELPEIQGGGLFELLDEVMAVLAREGHSIRYEAAIFVKSQLTISGILAELDPELKQDEYVMGRISSQVWKETPKRLLNTIWFPSWNSHDYRSLLSNEDVKDVQFQRIGRAFKKMGGAVWTAVSFRWLF